MDIDIFQYLQTLPPEALDTLYGGGVSTQAALDAAPWTCRAVVQSLPQVAKQYVMRLLCVDGYVALEAMKSWVDDAYASLHRLALERLWRLRLLVAAPADERLACLNPPFRRHLQLALCSPHRTPWRSRYPLKPDRNIPDRARIEGDMHAKWEGVLHFLVGSDFQELRMPPPPDVAIRFMESAGLMKSDGGGGLYITDKGYEFMLKDIHAQAWLFVLTLVRMYVNDPMKRDDLLSFLFQLSYCKVGEDYPLQALSPCQQDLVKDFVSLGLLFQRKAKSNRFYTTSAAVNLIFGAGASGGSQAVVAGTTSASAGGPSKVPTQASMSILVETNYQVVAYTTSKLHLNMLSLFVELRTRLPNVVIGIITRESMGKALASGISSTQVLEFLRWHAHPLALQRSPVIPENVADQVILWEGERTRVRYDPAVLIDVSAANQPEYDRILQTAQFSGGLLWAPATAKGPLVVSPLVQQQVQDCANTFIMR